MSKSKIAVGVKLIRATSYKRTQIVRPDCSHRDCENKARRIGKRQYGDTCDKHKTTYGAA